MTKLRLNVLIVVILTVSLFVFLFYRSNLAAHLWETILFIILLVLLILLQRRHVDIWKKNLKIKKSMHHHTLKGVV